MTAMASLGIIAVLFVVCQVVNLALDYQEIPDQPPRGTMDRILTTLHRILAGKEDKPQA